MFFPQMVSLEEQLKHAQDFRPIWNELLALCEQPIFLEQSIPALHPLLQEVLLNFARRRAQDQCEQEALSCAGERLVDNVMLLHYAPANFFHGVVLINGRLSSVLFFAESGLGLISTVESFDPPSSLLVRFSVVRQAKSGFLIAMGEA